MQISVMVAGACLLLGCAVPGAAQERAAAQFDEAAASRFAALALACVHKEYPNKIAHVPSSDADVQPPRELTPAFYGCYDWHSSVHGHWLLVRLARTFPDAPFAAKARAALGAEPDAASTSPREVRYLKAPGRASFERPYGLAWLLQLDAELRGVGRPAGAASWAADARAARATPPPRA